MVIRPAKRPATSNINSNNYQQQYYYSTKASCLGTASFELLYGKLRTENSKLKMEENGKWKMDASVGALVEG